VTFRSTLSWRIIPCLNGVSFLHLQLENAPRCGYKKPT